MVKAQEIHYNNMAKLISQNIKGRKLVLWGQNAVFNRFLNKYKLTVSFNIAEDDGIKDDTSITFEMISKHIGRYYILVPSTLRNKNDVTKLKALGYREGRDFLFVNRPRTIIPPETKEYSDIYGNVVHDHSGAKIILSPYAFGAEINIGEGCKVDKEFTITIFRAGSAKVNIGKNCTLKSSAIRVYGSGQITIGNKGYISEGDQFICMDNDIITVGDDLLMAKNSTIFSGDGHAIFDLETGKRTNLYELGDPKGTITIGSHVWIGMDVIVLNRASIGNNCIIGAKSLFKGDLSENCIAAGNPARCIRKNATWAHSPFAEVPPEIGLSGLDDLNEDSDDENG